jgi:hypothetical protein
MACLDFDDLFQKIKKISGGKNQTAVADKLGISPQAITDAKRKNKIPETWFDIIDEKFGVTKEEICQQVDKKNLPAVPPSQNFFPSQMLGAEEIIHRKQAGKDGYDQIMDEFFELVKEWQVEENGRSARTAIDFIQEFPKRFGEMAEWQGKRKGVISQNQFPEIKSSNGNE